MKVRAILCDSATVREGLLHILGGGLTRLWRSSYPAQLPAALAMVISPETSELNEDHQLVVKVMDEDGKELARFDQNFKVGGGTPGEVPAIPVVLSFAPPLPIPHAGNYAIVVLVNSTQEDYLGFTAMPAGAKP